MVGLRVLVLVFGICGLLGCLLKRLTVCYCCRFGLCRWFFRLFWDGDLEFDFGLYCLLWVWCW